MKRLIVGLMLLCGAKANAQYLQNEHTAEYSLRTMLSKIDNFHYGFTIQLRNETAFDPNEVFGITGLYVYGVPKANEMGRTTHTAESNIGNIGNAAYASPDDHPPFRYWEYPFSTAANFGNGIEEYSYDMFGFTGGYGLLGCSRPDWQWGAGSNYSGSTCSAAGQDGWKQLNLQFEFFYERPDYTGSDLNVVLKTWSEDRAAVAIVSPEPATWALMLVGLGVLGMVGRKRW